jgi:hypothetical protein
MDFSTVLFSLTNELCWNNKIGALISTVLSVFGLNVSLLGFDRKRAHWYDEINQQRERHSISQNRVVKWENKN